MSFYERAARILPGGVSSPVRAFTGVGGEPVFVRSGEGAYLVAEDGRRYIDYIGSYGPLIFGHRPPFVVAALEEVLTRGTSFGAPTVAEVELGELIASALPAMDMVRFVNSGTEATMSALRLARAATGRDRFVKFSGCYHGHADAFLVAAGSGAATLGVPSSPGVPKPVTADTLVAPMNDLDATKALFAEHGGEIAAVFVEPVGGNMGVLPPREGFLEGLRELTRDHGALLVFDEVMTGFRVAWGGAQVRFGIEPDLTTLGKVIGGGLPIAAYGGRRDLMERVAPAGDVYQAGTLSGNPLAVAAGFAALSYLRDHPETYDLLEKISAKLETGLAEVARRHGVPLRTQRVGSMLGIFFADPDTPIENGDDVEATDRALFKKIFHVMLREGVHLPPSAYEAFFLSTAHGDAEIDATIQAFDTALGEVAG